MSLGATRWAMTLDRADAGALAALRLVPGLEVAEASGSIWLRGEALAEDLRPLLQAIPAVARFERTGDALRWPAGLVPRGVLPPGPWRPLASAFPLTAPAITTTTSGAVPRAAVRLTRGGTLLPPAALLLPLAVWARFAIEAPTVRLQRWRFAASRGEGRVLVLGTPLPALPGEPFIAPAPGLLIPAGCTWTPAIDPAVLRAAAGARADDIVWWREREGILLLPAEQWVPATRSGARRLQDEGRIA